MEYSWRSTVSSAANIGLLTVLTILAALGYVACLPSMPMVDILGVLCVFELVLLAWAALSTPDRSNIGAGLAYCLKIQANAMSQVAATVLSSIAAGLGVVYLLNWIDPIPASAVWFSTANIELALRFAVPASVVSALVTAAWRMHAIRQHGLEFHALNGGALNVLECRLPASEELVRNRLEHYLTQLTGERAPGLARLYYGKKPTITRKSIGGQVVFEVVWAWCPAKMSIVVEQDGAFASTLRATCALRSGFWKSELMVNPIDAIALKTYLQTHAFQLLSSEMALSASTLKQDKLRSQALEMQLRILQAQIEPHFLFNTLASVRHLYRSSTDEGELMMDHVITYLRCTMQELRSDVSTVGKEMDLVLHYLAIMKIRMGERLSYSFIHPHEVAEWDFPPAMLISLVENAIKHGLHDRADGKLTISATREGERLTVSVQDNGPGFSSVQGTGVGLSNIRQRLEAIYGNCAWLEVGALADGGFVANIVVPFRRGPA